MQTITTIGLDIAKSVFQVHGVDAGGHVVIRRQLKRRSVLAFFQKLPPCLVGIEACASSHHWSRELQALGHSVRLMPPAYVKPYVKRQKNDMADAEAICEAVARANMRFVPTKTPGQQSCLMLHRTRHLFIRQQIAVINSIRAHLAEFGIVAPVGRKGVTELLIIVADPNEKRVPEVARVCLAALGTQLLSIKKQIVEFDRMILAWHRSNQTSKRLHYIPGVGPMLATALVASVADPQNLPIRTQLLGLDRARSQTALNEILTYDHLLEVAHLEQEQVAKHAVADKVYKLASGVMVLAVVAVGGHALFVQLSANALTPTTAAEQTALESAAIVTAEPAGEEAASASAVPPETSGPADVPSSAKVSAAERTPSDTAETAPRRVGPSLHRTPKHSPKFASGYIDRSIILYRLRKFARVFAEQSKHARLTRRHGNARPFGA